MDEAASFNLAEAALALAAVARPGLDLAPYRRHFSDLVAAAGRHRASGARRSDALIRAVSGDHGYRGDREGYDRLENADLARVVERRRGIPVSLGILYIATARGLGWRMSGLNTPGHFLVRLDGEDEGDDVVIDPFSGRPLDPGEPGSLPVAEDRAILIRLQNNIKSRLLDQERYEEASPVLERMLWILPRSAALWWESALVEAELGRIAGAIARLERCVGLDETGRARVEALKRALTAKLN